MLKDNSVAGLKAKLILEQCSTCDIFDFYIKIYIYIYYIYSNNCQLYVKNVSTARLLNINDCLVTPFY